MQASEKYALYLAEKRVLGFIYFVKGKNCNLLHWIKLFVHISYRILRYEICNMRQSKNYMKPQDIVILLKIICKGDQTWFHHTLAQELFISQSEVSQSLERSRYSGLIDSTKRKVSKLNLLDFIEYGIKYVFPQRPGPLERGIPTSHSTLPLNEEIISNEKFVWPDPKGHVRGQSIIPLYSSVTKAVGEDKVLYKYLALVDSIRVGRAREKKLAIEILRKNILDDK